MCLRSAASLAAERLRARTLLTCSGDLTDGSQWGKPFSTISVHAQENLMSPYLSWMKPQWALIWQSVLGYQRATQLSNIPLHQQTRGHSPSFHILAINLTDYTRVRAQRHPPLKSSQSWRTCTLPSRKPQTGDSDQPGCRSVAISHLHPKRQQFWVGARRGHCLAMT